MPKTTPDKQTGIAAKHGLAERTRWLDFSAYGMSLKLCVFKDAMALVMEGGDARVDIVKALGFVKIGDDWIREDVGFQPREFVEIAPDAMVKRDMLTDAILIEREDFVRPLFADAPSAAAKRAFGGRVAAAASKGMSADLVSILGAQETTRWMDFSAYGMALKRYAYADATLLVMEGGSTNPEIVKALGFVRIGDEWIRENTQFRPIEFRAIAPEAVLNPQMPTRDVLVDRSDSYRPATHWFASFETGGNEVQAFGANPEAAVQALSDAWLELAKNERVDPGLLVKFRDGISVVPFVSGKGYAKGIGDSNWYQGGLRGDDDRFDDVLPAPTRKRGDAPGYR